MFVYGVRQSGEDINVANDFSLHVPFGWCYDTDELNTGEEPALTLFQPETIPAEYQAGCFELNDDTDMNVQVAINRIGTVEVPDNEDAIDVDIEELLRQQSDQAKNISLLAALGALLSDADHTEDDESINDFHRMYKIIKDEPFLKVGYFTSGLYGKTVFNVLLFTSHHVYSAIQVKCLQDDFEKNEKLVDGILSSIKPLNVKVYAKSEEQKCFRQLEYTQNIMVNVGPLCVGLPDGFEYVTEDHVPANDKKAKLLLKDYALVAAESDCKGGLRGYRDASFGINLTEPVQTDISDEQWKYKDAIKQSIESSCGRKILKTVKEGKNYIIAFGKGNECGSDESSYWITFFVAILCGSLQYTGNLYFNTKKAKLSDYSKAVETFCKHITVNTKKTKKAATDRLRAELGDMLAENGRLKGILGPQLYSKDVIFNNDNEVNYDGKHTNITGFQLNAAVMDDYPKIKLHIRAVAQELKRLIVFVDQNENLMIPKEKLHPEILKATRNNPITGATVFELCAWHMLMINETDNNQYTVAIDTNLIRGIPDAYNFVGEFIKTLRAFNEISGDFEITFVPTKNYDGPCKEISSPVNGAVKGRLSKKYILSVSGSNVGLESPPKQSQTQTIPDKDNEHNTDKKQDNLERKAIGISNVTFFMNSEVCKWLYNQFGGNGQDVNVQLMEKDNFSYDVIDHPFHLTIKSDDDVALILYIRNQYGIYEEAQANAHMVFHKSGEKPSLIRQNGVSGDVNTTMLYYLKVAIQLRKYISTELYKKMADLDAEKEGVLVTLKNNDIVFEIVSGEKRPSLLCNSLLEGMHYARPYMDETVKSFTADQSDTFTEEQEDKVQTEKEKEKAEKERIKKEEEEKAKRQEEAKRQRAEKRKEAAERKREAKRQEEEKRKREQEAKEQLEAARAREIENRVNRKESMLQTFARSICPMIREEYRVKIGQQLAIRGAAEEKLKSLGLFKRNQKQEQRDIMAECDRIINGAQWVMKNADILSNITPRIAADLAKEDREYQKKLVDRLFPAQESTASQNKNTLSTQQQSAEQEVKKIILNVLSRSSQPMTVEMIQNSHNRLSSEYRIEQILDDLKAEGLVRCERIPGRYYEFLYAILDKPNVDTSVPTYDVMSIDFNNSNAVKWAIKQDLDFILRQWQYDSRQRIGLGDVYSKDVVDTRQIRIDLLRFYEVHEGQNIQTLSSILPDSLKGVFGGSLMASYCEKDLVSHGYLKEPYWKNGILTSALTDKGALLLALYRLFYEA